MKISWVVACGTGHRCLARTYLIIMLFYGLWEIFDDLTWI